MIETSKSEEREQLQKSSFLSVVAQKRTIDKPLYMVPEIQYCTFCGKTDDSLILSAEGCISCSGCRASKGEFECNEWLKWLKANNSEHWNKVVDHHRLGSTPISNLVRKIRIEA
ncbi:MAG: hypothetical protein K9G46_06890 [Flavobacteriales bacterium]|nr:hypothetical protein [Flavobacteriales bacterium]